MGKSRDKSIILLSGGLDSLVSLGVSREKYNVRLGLTFDYGQRAAGKEIKAGKDIAGYYGIGHRVIKLPWLEDITATSLVNKSENIPEYEFSMESAKNVWVPNRNGVFINIAASFADSMGFKHIIFGANREEAATFPDNSEEFVNKINGSLAYSTLVKAAVVAPLAVYNKKEIARIALENSVPLNLVRSCYREKDKHCGRCESCLRLKMALKEVLKNDLPVEFME